MNDRLNYRDIAPIPDALAQAVGDGFFAIWPVSMDSSRQNADRMRTGMDSAALVPKGLPMTASIERWGWATCPRCAKGFRFFKHAHGKPIYCLDCARY